jgi:small subunit ribosomal protein S15e
VVLELLLCKSFVLSTAIEPRDKGKKILFGLAGFFCLHLLVCFGNRFQRGLKRKPMALIKKLRKAKREAPTGEKPEPVRTHLRNMIIVPEMIGSVIGVYNGKTFNQVEIKPEMIGHYLAEFSISYKPVKHGRPGIGATHSSRFIPLK